MSSVKNRIHCHDCSRSFIDSNYSHHLRSQGHINIVMKKQCCSHNNAIARDKLCCNNLDLTCCMSELSLKSDVDIQTDFSDKKNRTGRKKLLIIALDIFPNEIKQKRKIMIKIKTPILIFC